MIEIFVHIYTLEIRKLEYLSNLYTIQYNKIILLLHGKGKSDMVIIGKNAFYLRYTSLFPFFSLTPPKFLPLSYW